MVGGGWSNMDVLRCVRGEPDGWARTLRSGVCILGYVSSTF